jgi:hypothetical protein
MLASVLILYRADKESGFDSHASIVMQKALEKVRHEPGVFSFCRRIYA